MEMRFNPSQMVWASAVSLVVATLKDHPQVKYGWIRQIIVIELVTSQLVMSIINAMKVWAMLIALENAILWFAHAT